MKKKEDEEGGKEKRRNVAGSALRVERTRGQSEQTLDWVLKYNCTLGSATNSYVVLVEEERLW